MDLQPPRSRMRTLFNVIVACATAGVMALLAAAVLLRWDREIHSLDHVRARLTLTLVGVAVGAWLAKAQADGARQYRKTAIVGLILIGLSQGVYLAMVWTDWKVKPLTWRLWWLAVVGALTTTHVVWLRLNAPHDRSRMLRFTVLCAVIAAVLWTWLAFRKHLMANVDPWYIATLAVPAAAACVGSFVLWLRMARRMPSRRLPRGAKYAWVAAAQLAVVLLSFYAGRVSAPAESPFEVLPAVLVDLKSQELDAQLRSDLDRLKIVATGLDELAEKTSRLSKAIRAKREADGREYFLPEEDEQIRGQHMSFLAYRAALLRLVATYLRFEAVRDPESRARCMLVGYGAAATLYQSSLRLLARFWDDPVARRKLNEPDALCGIPAGMLDRVRETIANPATLQTMAEMSALFTARRADWAAARVWPEADFQWLQSRIDAATAEMKTSGIHTQQARFEQILARVTADARAPVYTAQSVVSTWIGDTRLVERRPLITLEQIAAIRGQLQPGDILLERRNWFLSNAFLPGFWPHGALYVGTIEDLSRLGLARRDGGRWTSDDPEIRARLDDFSRAAPDGEPHCIIESVSEGVIFNSLSESMHADYVAALRPRLVPAQKAQAIARAFKHVGKPYDFEFDFATADKLVCTELVYRAYEGLLHFKLVRVMGRDTLPALEIARKFATEREKLDRELDFVLFLDGHPDEGCARAADAARLCESIQRPTGYQGEE